MKAEAEATLSLILLLKLRRWTFLLWLSACYYVVIARAMSVKERVQSFT